MARTPIHPGEILAEELAALNVSAAELARHLNVPANRITGILNGARSVSADTALRLGSSGWLKAKRAARSSGCLDGWRSLSFSQAN